MTDDQARAQLISLLPLVSPSQLDALKTLPPTELAAVIEGVGLAAQAEDLPIWRSVLDFVRAHESALAWLGPVGVAVQGAIDVAEAATGG